MGLGKFKMSSLKDKLKIGNKGKKITKEKKVKKVTKEVKKTIGREVKKNKTNK